MTAKILMFGDKTKAKPSISKIEVHVAPDPPAPDARAGFDPDGSEFLTDRTVNFLSDLADLVQNYEIDSGRIASLNIVVHSCDGERVSAYAYCRDAEQEESEIKGEYYDVAAMVPGLDMLDVLSPYPPPEDDEEFSRIYEENQGEEEDGVKYNIWWGRAEYDFT